MASLVNNTYRQMTSPPAFGFESERCHADSAVFFINQDEESRNIKNDSTENKADESTKLEESRSERNSSKIRDYLPLFGMIEGAINLKHMPKSDKMQNKWAHKVRILIAISNAGIVLVFADAINTWINHSKEKNASVSGRRISNEEESSSSNKA